MPVEPISTARVGVNRLRTRVGVVREIKPAERRVALTPAGATMLSRAGNEVLVESGAGVGSGFDNDDYADAGARILATASDVWQKSDLLLKVKEPVASEYRWLREDLVLFCYLHLAADMPLTTALMQSGTTALAYETIEDAHGALPLLTPMSEIAGRLAAQAGAYFLQAPYGGNGKLMGGAPGVRPARVVVIGGGGVGTHAARTAVGIGAEVTILERSLARVRHLEEQFAGRARVLVSDPLTLEAELLQADVVVGAVLIQGARAPRLVERRHLSAMPTGSVLVDVAVDQGGCADTTRATTHEDPTYEVDGVVHYSVANMPGAVPVTATAALTNATIPYVLRLAAGVGVALEQDPGLRRGLNVQGGRITCPPVGEAYDKHNAAAQQQASG